MKNIFIDKYGLDDTTKGISKPTDAYNPKGASMYGSNPKEGIKKAQTYNLVESAIGTINADYQQTQYNDSLMLERAKENLINKMKAKSIQRAQMQARRNSIYGGNV